MRKAKLENDAERIAEWLLGGETRTPSAGSADMKEERKILERIAQQAEETELVFFIKQKRLIAIPTSAEAGKSRILFGNGGMFREEQGAFLEICLERLSLPYSVYENFLEVGHSSFEIEKVDGMKQRYQAVSLGPGDNGGRFGKICREEGETKPLIYIRTFGYFDVFVDREPILFRSEKSKELLALLVDRKGGYVSPDEGICVLWENEVLTDNAKNRYRKVAHRLKEELDQRGIGYIIEAKGGARRLNTDAVECDYYQYLSLSKEYQHLFWGQYMQNYSWAEVTLARLVEICRSHYLKVTP